MATGPFFDHTLFGQAGGKYMYMETSSGTTGDTAVMVSAEVDVSSLTAPYLEFYYHMYGAAQDAEYCAHKGRRV